MTLTPEWHLKCAERAQTKHPEMAKLALAAISAELGGSLSVRQLTKSELVTLATKLLAAQKGPETAADKSP